MTISLCPVLMNFSMQITHLNPKWSPVLFVFRHAQTKSPKKTCLFLPFVASDVCFSAPRFSVCVCGLADGRAQLSTANNWRNRLRILEFKMTSTHHQKLSICATKVCESKLQQQKKDPQLSVMILPFFFSLPCSAAHEPTGDYFLRAQHLYLLHLACIFTLLFLPDDCPALVFSSSEAWQAGRARKRGERMVSRRFTTLWICHFEDEVYECI